jgi:hypothetical protein
VLKCWSWKITVEVLAPSEERLLLLKETEEKLQLLGLWGSELQMLKAIVVVVAISNRYGWTATKSLLRKSTKLLLLMFLNPPHHLYYCLQVLLL